MISSVSIFAPVFAMDIAFAVEKFCSQHNDICWARPWLLTELAHEMKLPARIENN
jgi:hypothetical protein